MRKLSIKHKISIFIYILFILILLIFRIVISYYLNNMFFESENILKLKPSKNSDDTNYIKYSNIGNTKKTFTYLVSKNELNKFSNEIKAILLYKLTGISYEIYFNDTLIGLNGGANHNQSNIWNDVKTFPISNKDIKEKNIIKIITNNIYESGFLGFPPIISELKELQIIENNILLWINGFTWFTYGVLVAGILIFIAIAFLNKEKMTLNILIALGQFFLLISLLDYLVFQKIFFQIIIFKKIILSSYYFSVATISFALNRYFKKKVLTIIAFITLILGILIFSFTNLLSLMNVISYLNFILIINMTIWIIFSYRESKDKIPFLFIMLGSLILVFSSLFDIINIFFHKPYTSFFMFGVVGFVITLSSLLIKDYSYINEQYIKQRKDSKIYYENSIKDELTGLYNRRFFNNKVKKIKEEYLLIFFDVDDFKKINDEYGHYIGDEVLKKIAKITENIVRESDIVCRYGGDEFIILLKNCPKNKAIDIANNLIRKINSDIIIDGQSYNITISAGLFRKNKDMDFEEVFKSTDNLLRKAKNNGKAKLEFK